MVIDRVAPVEADQCRYQELRIVLVEPRNPLNIGAVARAMSNFGFTRLRLVRPYSVAFEEARSAVGASHILQQAEVFEQLRDAIADCTLVVGTTSVAQRELKQPLRRLELGARLIRQHVLSSPAALLFGSERYGLTTDDLSYCHWLMRIPTRREHGSMNLGQAVAVCLYELVRNPRAARAEPKARSLAPAEQLDRLVDLMTEVLANVGFIKPRIEASSLQKLRRLVRRMHLNAEDAQVWLGIFRQIRWKLSVLEAARANLDGDDEGASPVPPAKTP